MPDNEKMTRESTVDNSGVTPDRSAAEPMSEPRRAAARPMPDQARNESEPDRTVVPPAPDKTALDTADKPALSQRTNEQRMNDQRTNDQPAFADRTNGERPTDKPAVAQRSTEKAGVAQRSDRHADLFEADVVTQYQNDWHAVQASFVDDPAAAVRDADALLGRMVDTLTARISQQRGALSTRHGDGAEGEHTEELRQALRDYRTMFHQLLPQSPSGVNGSSVHHG